MPSRIGCIGRFSVINTWLAKLLMRRVRHVLAAGVLAASMSAGILPAAAAPIPSCVPPPADLLSWWPGNGSTAELVGGRAGMLRNGATFATGEVGQAFSFNGVNQFVEVPDDPAWTLGSAAFTIDLWVNFTQVNPRDPFMGHDEGGGELNKWIFWYDESGHTTPAGPALRFHINSLTLGPIDTISVPWVPATNVWYHVAVTRSGSSYALYLNGAQIGTATDAHVLPNPAAPLTIGRAESFFHNGRVDEAEIFQRALSPAEIAALFNAGSAGKCPVGPSCGMSGAGSDVAGRQFIRIAAQDASSGLKSIRVTQATNATVTVPTFAVGTRSPVVVTATKQNQALSSQVALQVTNVAGRTLACDPVIAELTAQRSGDSRQVFSNLLRAESKVQLTNGHPGLGRVDLRVNGHHFRLDDLKDNEVRTIDVASAMRPGNANTIVVTTHGPHHSSAMLVISD